MFFKNATVFHLNGLVDPERLIEGLKLNRLSELSPSELDSFGAMPLVRNSELWALCSNDCLLMRFGKEEKILPSSVVREELEKKVAQIELMEGRKVGRKEKSDMKDEIIFTLRPKAFSKISDVWAHVDNKAKLLVIYSTSGAMIELVFKYLKTVFGTFAMIPLRAQVSPSLVMTEWLQRNSLPSSMVTGDRCDIEDKSEDRSKITFKNLEPLSDDVTRHLEQGMNVKSLALSWSHIDFTLHDDLTIRKIRWADGLKESAFNDSQGGALSDMDANFAVASLGFREFYFSLSSWFEI